MTKGWWLQLSVLLSALVTMLRKLKLELFLEGLQMASELKIKCVALESDSALAVDASNATTRNHCQFWSVYKEIGLAKSVFSSCSISYTRRKLNSLAHELAKRASVSGVCSRWFDPVPEDIASLAKRDLVNIVYV
jgi:hypothetical protein